MSHAIKFHSAHRDLAHIQIYIDNGFLIPNRFIDIVAIGIHHGNWLHQHDSTIHAK